MRCKGTRLISVQSREYSGITDRVMRSTLQAPRKSFWEYPSKLWHREVIWQNSASGGVVKKVVLNQQFGSSYIWERTLEFTISNSTWQAPACVLVYLSFDIEKRYLNSKWFIFPLLVHYYPLCSFPAKLVSFEPWQSCGRISSILYNLHQPTNICLEWGNAVEETLVPGGSIWLPSEWVASQTASSCLGT